VSTAEKKGLSEKKPINTQLQQRGAQGSAGRVQSASVRKEQDQRITRNQTTKELVKKPDPTSQRKSTRVPKSATVNNLKTNKDSSAIEILEITRSALPPTNAQPTPEPISVPISVWIYQEPVLTKQDMPTADSDNSSEADNAEPTYLKYKN